MEIIHDKQIDPNEELKIDFCPRCGENFPDKKVGTRINHDKLHHPETEKTRKRKFKDLINGTAFAYLFLYFVLPVLVIWFAVDMVFRYTIEIEYTELFNKCNETIDYLSTKLSTGTFTEDDLQTWNTNYKSCGVGTVTSTVNSTVINAHLATLNGNS